MNDLAQGARTRAGLIAASIELFDRDGYEGTSLDSVCRAISVTKGALYRHFPSKQALAVAVVEEHFRRWHEVRVEVEGSGAGPLQTLIDLTHRMGSLTRTDRTVRVGVRLLFTSELFELLAGVHFVSLVAMVRDLLGQAVAADEVRPSLDTREEADGIAAAVIGAQAMTVITSRGDPADRLATMWRHRLEHLVAPERRAHVRATALVG
ncbi:AcrR family transcriptional regulator [Saccharothrix tamanrassetensis]|uniref:AcrR family transcriptional regulator n=1 Tax=Saccharothrix tamanrassetensis TaxID=1051531 RepID=A0A841CTK4_9PSEU|nr:TetR/AcrR family transcriptional regulator [Saccharothrix tamanrassetensis]MBB5960193.1 AcrR family transcriptional regulator [Saccharothrix tamanrassetensis]